MSSVFKQPVEIVAPGKNAFDLSHSKKLSCLGGYLVPIMLQEVLPGDKFRVHSEIMVRLAPMLAPLYAELNVYSHWFFVPNRIIYSEWEKFITGGEDGLQAPVHPALNLNSTNHVTGSLSDYFGIPTASYGAAVNQNVNLLPFRAYQEIWNEYYRDQNLIARFNFSKASGVITSADPDYAQLMELHKRAWERDYFTSCLPNPQRGAAASAPISTAGASPNYLRANNASTGAALVNQTGFTTDAAGDIHLTPAGAGVYVQFKNAGDGTVGSLLISELRKANALQKFMEKMNRGGARLTEVILMQFGVKSSDARLQRPEYLGGARSPVTISEVTSTYQLNTTPPNLPQGNLAGHGIGYSDEHGFPESFFEEHGFIIGLMSILPRAEYFQGLNKMWQRPTRLDYYWPDFAQLGDQAVLNKELYLETAAAGTNDGTFGYIPKFSEYKFAPSTIHGDFRSSLAYWHMARTFAARPALNQAFIECTPRTDIFAVPGSAGTPHYFVNVMNSVDAVRPLPFYVTPRI